MPYLELQSYPYTGCLAKAACLVPESPLKRSDQLRHNAVTHRRIQLPTLARDGLRAEPYLVFREWLQGVEEAIGQCWILLALNEFERLQEMLEAGWVDTRIFGFLRNLIQHHPRVTLAERLHSMEDLPPIWSDHFINIRVLPIGDLREDEARELIEKPIENFPLEYEPAAVERILSVTGCQPYLVQVTCRDLVNALNEVNCLYDAPVDAERALESALTSGAAYFQDLWSNIRDSDDTQRAVMRAIAKGQGLAGLAALLDLEAALRKLVHHDILIPTDGGYRFRVELVCRWAERNTL